jgi:thiamine-phosphate pyrophosphorylase
MGLREFALQLRAADVTLVQWRDKSGSPQEVLAGAATLRDAFVGTECRLMMNDRADLAVLVGFGGVHVGQGDLSPEDARRVVGAGGMIGVSTHTDEQVRVADAGCADYVAVGPVFATGTKVDAEAVIGLEGVRRARALTSKPIVAIGGITLSNARSVIDAGADSVAVISALLNGAESIEKTARDFIELLR